jgi:hypothetical protein
MTEAVLASTLINKLNCIGVVISVIILQCLFFLSVSSRILSDECGLKKTMTKTKPILGEADEISLQEKNIYRTVLKINVLVLVNLTHLSS